MENDETEARIAAGSLRLDGAVIVARAAMSAERADEAKAAGEVSMPARRTVSLEVGGVAVAEGRIARRKGVSVMIVEKAYGNGGEA